MRILVAFASERGGTEGLADMVGSAMRFQGHDVVVRPARTITDLNGVDAVLLGGSIYFGHWNPAAIDFVDRHAPVLRTLPVWFFASGPLDTEAAHAPIKPIGQVKAAMKKVNANGQVTFGGRLTEAQCDSFLARRMAKKHPGDFRDFAQVASWVDAVNKELWMLRIADVANHAPEVTEGVAVSHLEAV